MTLEPPEFWAIVAVLAAVVAGVLFATGVGLGYCVLGAALVVGCGVVSAA